MPRPDPRRWPNGWYPCEMISPVPNDETQEARGPTPIRPVSDLRRLLFTAVAAVAGLLAASAPASAEKAIDLIGAWHVLIHYTDDHTHDPEQMRWDDRIWVFETTGSRIRWTEYPIVVFKDQRGRFESLGGSHASRVLHAWEPNESQRNQIQRGLEVNDRGSLKKTLRSTDDGWQSAKRTQQASVSIVTYQQNWIIRGEPDLPVFLREDILGAASTESVDGLTTYATTEVRRDGLELVGTFERDGTRHGTFRMTRTGKVEGVKGSGKTQNERFRDLMQESLLPESAPD